MDTVEILVQAGGKIWEKGTMKRVYFGADVVLPKVGFKVNYYGTGNVSGATLKGEAISNSEAKRIMAAMQFAKVYYDFADGKFHWKFDDFSSGYSWIAREFCAGLRAQMEVTA